MQISDIESKRLLPNWAHGIDWIQSVFDFIVKTCSTRIPALDAPLTRKSIECLTDGELEEWFDRFGVVDYYPELTRETRENMLYWLARLYRFLGTPQAVRILCEYIHDGGPLNVGVIDNLAWNGETLVDSSLLDMFDVEIEAESPQITPSLAYRIRKNILRIARNSQQLRNIIYQYVSWITVPVSSVQDIGAAIRVQNWELARYVPPVVVLPTVTSMTVYNRSGGVVTLQTGETSGYLYKSTSDVSTYILWDSTKTQCVYYWRNAGLTAFGYGALDTLQSNNRVTVKNIALSNLASVYSYRYAECSDPAAIVATVYNANNSSFNAFKFTANNTDYYYVLDGTQTDWTDNLAAIGYSTTPSVVWRGYFNQNKLPVHVTASWEGNLYNESGQLIPYTAYRILRIINSIGNPVSVPLYSVAFLNDGGLLRFKNNSGQVLYNALYVEFYKESIEVFFYLKTDHALASFSANDYWASIVIDVTDRSALRAFGVDVAIISGHNVIGRNQQDTSLLFSPIGLYSGVREGDLQADMSNFYCADGPNNSGSVYYGLCIKSINAYATQSMTWKCRIARKS